ncbi:MAG: ATP-grasp domain-containing protein [Pseudomonadota bacterium]
MIDVRMLLLGASGPLNLKTLYCAARCGTVHLATDAGNVAARSRYAASHDVVDLKAAPGQSLATLAEICRRYDIEVVIPGDMAAAAFLAEHRGELPAPIFPASDAAALHAIHDKWSFAERLQAANLPTPTTRLIPSRAAFDPAIADAIGYPLIVKPLNGESSHGVVRIDGPDRLRAHVLGDAPYSEPPLIVQQFVDGYDIDCSVIAEEGEVIASAVQRWDEKGALAFERNDAIEAQSAAIIREFGYTGAAHFDFRHDAATGRFLVLECNPRFWFTMPAAMWCGLNFVEAGIRHVLGMPTAPAATASGEYVLPGDIVRRFATPGKLANVRRSNWRGFLQPVTDPIPHFFSTGR